MQSPFLSSISSAAVGYWNSQLLFTIIKTGICDIIPDEGADAERLCSLTGMKLEMLCRLLDAAVASRFISFKDRRYCLSEEQRRYLRSDGNRSIVRWLEIMSRWYLEWATLADRIREDRPVVGDFGQTEGTFCDVQTFIRGMHEFARLDADDAVAVYDLSGVANLADLGGGAGTYSIALCKRYPGLRATIYDLPAVRPVAEDVVRTAGAAASITFAEYDLNAFLPLPRTDAMLISNLIHQEPIPITKKIFRIAAQSLRSGGQLLIQGFFLDEDRKGPAFTALHGLSALVLWQDGRGYTIEETVHLAAEEGFIDGRILKRAPSGFTQIQLTAQ
jgi:hypothetical protein